MGGLSLAISAVVRGISAKSELDRVKRPSPFSSQVSCPMLPRAVREALRTSSLGSAQGDAQGRDSACVLALTKKLGGCGPLRWLLGLLENRDQARIAPLPQCTLGGLSDRLNLILGPGSNQGTQGYGFPDLAKGGCRGVPDLAVCICSQDRHQLPGGPAGLERGQAIARRPPAQRRLNPRTAASSRPPSALSLPMYARPSATSSLTGAYSSLDNACRKGLNRSHVPQCVERTCSRSPHLRVLVSQQNPDQRFKVHLLQGNHRRFTNVRVRVVFARPQPAGATPSHRLAHPGPRLLEP